MILASRLAGETRLVVLDADSTEAFTRGARNTYEGLPSEALAEPDETRFAHLIAAKGGGRRTGSRGNRRLRHGAISTDICNQR